VASDGNCLRMFQAVIDARTLLLEVGAQKREVYRSQVRCSVFHFVAQQSYTGNHSQFQNECLEWNFSLQTTMSFSSNTSSGYSFEPQKPPGELFNIVSLQSSARPGCIIELEPIADAAQVSVCQTGLYHRARTHS
jgi:hypothetical protein